ncbi:MAG: UDP-N-acetylmuramate dehydrogenase [Demequinaceae bacterium]|nr:UDP-N-acetylmuramate dehydrogenase [Demequinaceae bacterium]
MRPGPTFADLTTLRVGGRVGVLVDAATEEDVVDAVRGADDLGASLLVLGGGSNVVVSDAGFPGAVVRDTRTDIAADRDADDTVRVTVAAGTPWDGLVERTVAEGWAGIEAMSGIPGSTGATPVQNVGAYGREVAEVISSVKVWDRADGRLRTLSREECDFSYRDSLLKRSMRGEAEDGRHWRPTPRFVVLEVVFRLEEAPLSAPIAYAELAKTLGVPVGKRVPLADAREAVLALRRTKGMLLDPRDHDTWSVGSFFTNPILSADDADRLPEEAPRYPVEGADGSVKTSAAWLITRAGFGRGFALAPGAPVSLSTKHTLALTNRGGATAADILALARHIRDGVREDFGVTLEPEPVLVGLSL